jgi:hypothetical protein
MIASLVLGCAIAAIPYAVEDLPKVGMVGWIGTAGVSLTVPGIFVGLAATLFSGGNAHSMSRTAVNVGDVLFYVAYRSPCSR